MQLSWCGFQAVPPLERQGCCSLPGRIEGGEGEQEKVFPEGRAESGRETAGGTPNTPSPTPLLGRGSSGPVALLPPLACVWHS